jgi:hypothetical protein
MTYKGFIPYQQCQYTKEPLNASQEAFQTYLTGFPYKQETHIITMKRFPRLNRFIDLYLDPIINKLLLKPVKKTQKKVIYPSSTCL